MNSAVTADAPGKAIICGEYAVLRGGAAIVAALDCRARVTLVPSGGTAHTVTMPGLADGRWRFRLSSGGKCRWLDDPPAGGRALLEAALSVCGIHTLPCVDLSIDTRPFFDRHTGRKLGLGGSAAAMTALVSALCRFKGAGESGLQTAARAHAVLQGGHGSGVDIASSYHGGVIEFLKKDLQVLARTWPAGLHSALLWSGIPAQTESRISSLSQPGSTAVGWDLLCKSANNAAATWASGDVATLLHGLHEFSRALWSFSDTNKLHVFAAGHDKLSELAEAMPVVYKPCGAGGGDVGMVFGTDPAAIASFCDAAGKRGFSPLPFARDDHGVRVSPGYDCD